MTKNNLRVILRFFTIFFKKHLHIGLLIFYYTFYLWQHIFGAADDFGVIGDHSDFDDKYYSG